MAPPGGFLSDYLTEVDRLSTVSRRNRMRLLEAARGGDVAAKKSCLESWLFDAARIAMNHPTPAWMSDIDKIQEANIVLLRVIDDEGIVDVAAALKVRIPQALDRISSPGS